MVSIRAGKTARPFEFPDQLGSSNSTLSIGASGELHWRLPQEVDAPLVSCGLLHDNGSGGS